MAASLGGSGAVENYDGGAQEKETLSDIVRWLHQGQWTALLRVGRGLDGGMLFFREGKLHRAEWGHLMGDNAFYALAQSQPEEFLLMERDISDVRSNVFKDTEVLITELQELDAPTHLADEDFVALSV